MIHPQMYFEVRFSPAVIRARPWRSCLPSPSSREQREGPAKCRVSRVLESIAGEPQACHQPTVRGPLSPLLRTRRAGGSLVLPAQASSDVDTLLGSCSFRAYFQPPRGHSWRGCRPGIRHLALPRSLSNLGQTLCPHLHRWVPGQRVPSAGRRRG